MSQWLVSIPVCLSERVPRECYLEVEAYPECRQQLLLGWGLRWNTAFWKGGSVEDRHSLSVSWPLMLWAAFNQCESSHIVVYQTQRSLQPSSSGYKVDILWMGDCDHMTWCHSLCFQMLPLGLRSQRKPPTLPLGCILASLQGPLMLSHLFSVCIIDEWMFLSSSSNYTLQ